MKAKHSLSYYIGNFFIVSSLVGFLFLFYPVIGIYLFPPHIKSQKAVAQQKGTFLTIPKISAQAPVIENVDPNNEAVYMQALKKGVAQAKGTALPGHPGTVFLFAHSSGAPWDMTRMNTVFLKLGELNAGDSIIIERKGVIIHYKVRDKKEVLPTEVGYMLSTKRNQLILQTCTPIGTSLKRLLVFADPQ